MSWTRRAGAAAAAVVLAVLVPLGGVGASAAVAAGPLPGPVDPFPLLPSTANRVFTSAGQIGDNTLSWAMQYAMAMNQNKAPGTVVKQPITAPAALTRAGAASNLLVGGFLTGFTIGTAGVGIYASVTGTDPLPGVCGSGLEVVSSFLYLGMVPDCSAQIVEGQINADVTAVPVGWTGPPVAFNGPYTHGGSNITGSGISVRVVSSSAFTSRNPVLALTGEGYVSGSLVHSGCSLGFKGGGYQYQRRDSAGQFSSYASGAWIPCASSSSIYWGSASAGVFSPSTSTSTTATFPSNAGLGWRLALVRLDGTTVYYYPDGAPDRPAGLSADPVRKPTCHITWTDGVITSFEGTHYKESGGFPVGGIESMCTEAFVSRPGGGPGLLPSEIKVGSTNVEDGSHTELATQPVPDFTESEKVGLTPGDNTGLRLLKVVDGVPQSCMTWEANCAGWWTATSSGTVAETAGGTYQCQFGGRAVGLAECGVYRQTFDIRTDTPTITDPSTGNQADWSAATRPGNSTSPGGAGDVAPGQKCMTEWGEVANPLEWVFHPVKCALVWAFVPRTSVLQDGVSGLGEAAGGVATVQPLLDLIGMLPTTSGCSGIPIRLQFFGQEANGTLLAACEGEARTVATVVNGLSTLLIITAALVALLRYAAAVFGFVGPGGSFEQVERATERASARSGKGSD